MLDPINDSKSKVELTRRYAEYGHLESFYIMWYNIIVRYILTEGGHAVAPVAMAQAFWASYA